jgi:hypothetical protein
MFHRTAKPDDVPLIQINERICKSASFVGLLPSSLGERLGQRHGAIEDDFFDYSNAL